MAVTVLVAVKNEYLTYENIFKGIHDDEKERLFLTGDHLFVISTTCPLFPCFDVSDCYGPFSTMCFALCFFWLKANQSVALHVTLFVCLVTRRDLAETILVVIISS